MIRSLPRSLYPTYGWVIVVVAALAMVATLPGRTHGLGMVTERLLADEAFGDLDAGMLDGSEGGTLEERQKRRREAYSDMNLWGTLLGALFCLPCGRLIDRFGLRITLTTTVVALAAVVIGMTYLSGKWPLFAAILLTRGFGQSALSVISITMVGKWYRGRLGPPMAVYSLLLSFGFVGAARCAKPFALDDWRVVWGGMGWMLLLGMVPIAWLFTRDPSARDRDDLEQPLPVEMGYTLAQAIRTPAFWVFGLAISVVAVNTSGQSLFSESILTQQGFRVDAYYDLMILSGSIGLLAQLPVGWLLRFFPLGRMQAVGLFLMGACLFWLPSIHAQWQLTTYAVVMGLAGTTMTLLFFTIWGQAFGRAHLGEIQAVAQMLTVLASASGPKLLSRCLTLTDSYALMFHVLAGTSLVLAGISWLVRVPRPEDAPRSYENVADTPLTSLSVSGTID